MKSKKQEEEDFWSLIITLFGGFIIGGIAGAINWITGNHW